MDNLTPKINLIYYKNLLDNAIGRFFGISGNEFIRSGNDYVFTCSEGRKRIKDKIEECVVEEIDSITKHYDILKPNFYFIIGSCLPCDNILLSYENKNRPISKKLKLVIEKNPNMKYFMKESDIHIDNDLFNCIFEDIFNKYFRHKNILSRFGEGKKNIFFIKNTDLDCYMTYRIIKDVFGRININNMYKQHKDMMSDNLRSINEIIGSFINRKKEICRSDDFSFRRKSIEEYMNNCMSWKI